MSSSPAAARKPALPPFEFRPYQLELMRRVEACTDYEVVLGTCVNSGKTEMALELAARHLAKNPSSHVLILAHGRTVLRTNFEDRLAQRHPELTDRIHVHIPQETGVGQLQGVDLVIVDEADEYYEVEGGMDQEIIAEIGPKQVILMTGTPFCFLARGLKPVYYSLQQLNTEGKSLWSSDVAIELGVSAYDIHKWNRRGDAILDVPVKKQQTKKTLDDLLEMLVERLRKPRNLTGHRWNAVVCELSQTVFVCSNIDMANSVHAYFVSEGVNVLISTSKDDVDSSEIATFKHDAKQKILIVVDRANRGLDCPGLVNLIDLTGSKNPTRLHQMIGRVLRLDREGQPIKTLYVKLMPQAFSDSALRYFMSGVLMLFRTEVYEKYTGRGIKLLMIPTRPSTKKTHKNPLHPHNRRPFLESGMLLFGDFFRGLDHCGDKGYESMAFLRLGDLLGERTMDPEGKMQAIKDDFERLGQKIWKSSYENNGDIRAYCHHFPDFTAWCKEKGRPTVRPYSSSKIRRGTPVSITHPEVWATVVEKEKNVDVSHGSGKILLHRCDKNLGHPDFKAAMQYRCRGFGCPKCGQTGMIKGGQRGAATGAGTAAAAKKKHER